MPSAFRRAITSITTFSCCSLRGSRFASRKNHETYPIPLAPIVPCPSLDPHQSTCPAFQDAAHSDKPDAAFPSGREWHAYPKDALAGNRLPAGRWLPLQESPQLSLDNAHLMRRDERNMRCANKTLLTQLYQGSAFVLVLLTEAVFHQ